MAFDVISHSSAVVRSGPPAKPLIRVTSRGRSSEVDLGSVYALLPFTRGELSLSASAGGPRLTH